MPAVFTERVIEIVKAIPPGSVLSYGVVAAMAGNPRGARQVARILHSSSEKHNLPWHRVLSAKGCISLPGPGGDVQRQLLEAEGVVFGKDGCIRKDGSSFRGIPEDDR
ncbi:MAG: MGMT family protein [Spirochaetales bacterium]|nr:MGMT family protein [Spirochaetales bacterium]